MTNAFRFRALATFFLASQVAAAGAAESPEVPALSIPTTNPPASFSERIGATAIEVHYSRPSARGREIFGALVPYDRVWRTGADRATKIRFSTPVKVEGVAIPAGDYELFTIPRPGDWTVIFQNDRSRWGSYDYDPALDVARLSARPVRLAEPVETLTIALGDMAGDAATLSIAWERIRLPLRLEVDVVGQLVPQIEAAMHAPGKRPYFLAAMFYFEHEIDVDKAAEWMNAAVAERPDHIGMLHRLALILERKGDFTGARAAAERSLAGAAGASPELADEYTRLNRALLARLPG